MHSPVSSIPSATILQNFQVLADLQPNDKLLYDASAGTLKKDERYLQLIRRATFGAFKAESLKPLFDRAIEIIRGAEKSPNELEDAQKIYGLFLKAIGGLYQLATTYEQEQKAAQSQMLRDLASVYQKAFVTLPGLTERKPKTRRAMRAPHIAPPLQRKSEIMGNNSPSLASSASGDSSSFEILSYNVETAVQGGKAMQDFKLESPTPGGENARKVKAAPVVSDYGSNDCVDVPSSATVSRLNIPSQIRSSAQDRQNEETPVKSHSEILVIKLDEAEFLAKLPNQQTEEEAIPIEAYPTDNSHEYQEYPCKDQSCFTFLGSLLCLCNKC